jgi:hypothetical protein
MDKVAKLAKFQHVLLNGVQVAAGSNPVTTIYFSPVSHCFFVEKGFPVSGVPFFNFSSFYPFIPPFSDFFRQMADSHFLHFNLAFSHTGPVIANAMAGLFYLGAF